MPDNVSKTRPDAGASPLDPKAARRKRITFWSQVLLVLAVTLPLLWGYVLRPLKYRYPIRRIEFARTPEEERDAFRLAKRWGGLYEVTRVDPQYLAAKGMPHPDAAWIRIQWISGDAAIHRLLDTNNLALLFWKK